MECNNNLENISKYNLKTFLGTVLYQNPIWDLGLQFDYARRDFDNIFKNEAEKYQKLTKKCICPCSDKVEKWHKTTKIDKLDGFQVCKAALFPSSDKFVKHLYKSKDHHHKIILRIVQNLYSSIICKFKATGNIATIQGEL